eukprot:3123860-Alexandrium_andersonii.AAC.1
MYVLEGKGPNATPSEATVVGLDLGDRLLEPLGAVAVVDAIELLDFGIAPPPADPASGIAQVVVGGNAPSTDVAH